MSCWPQCNRFVCYSVLLPLLDSRLRAVLLFSEVRRASSKKVRDPESHVAHYPAPFVFLLIFLDSRDGLRFKGRNAPRSPSGFWHKVSFFRSIRNVREVTRSHSVNQIKSAIFPSACRILIAS